MTEQQFQRWKRLSLGLVAAYPREMRREVSGYVEELIACICDGYDLADVCDWDGNSGKAYPCDRVGQFLYEEDLEDEHGEWTPIGTAVSACVRAGFDVAVAPSGGVVGFTVGDLRRVYGRKLPKWVREWFDPPLPMRVSNRAGLWM